MVKKRTKLQAIKTSFLKKDLVVLNRSTKELFAHGQHYPLHPLDIKQCYQNIESTWIGLNMHKCFLSLCVDHLKMFGADKNKMVSDGLKVQDYKILDGRTLKAAENKILNWNKKSTPKAKKSISVSSIHPVSVIDDLISKLNKESMALYNIEIEYGKELMDKWLGDLDIIKGRILSRGTVDEK